MRATYRALGAAGGIAILSACTGGQSAVEPPFNAVNVQQQSSLQFRVGTVNWRGLATFTNTVVTFRQPNGLSATLYNTPTIAGPAGWVVPTNTPPVCSTTGAASGANTDAGTTAVTGTQPTQPGTTALATTFAQQGGAFAYGFAPADSATNGVSFYPGFSASSGGRAFATQIGTYTDLYPQPIYCQSTRKMPYLLGPPITPDFHPASAGFPAGFIGYDSGFMSFGVAPVAGTYNLTLTVPSNTIGQLAATFNQAATMTTTTPLGTVAPPVVTEAGLSLTCTTACGPVSFTVAPAPAGATSQVLYVVDQSSSTFWSFNAGTAGGVFTLPASSFASGDVIRAYVAAGNWDIAGDAPPNNTSPTPPLPAQTDVSLSNFNSIAF